MCGLMEDITETRLLGIAVETYTDETELCMPNEAQYFVIISIDIFHV